ncbi:MAG: hypothetical protein ACREEM_37910 [Blastocatellia bacterium]
MNCTKFGALMYWSKVRGSRNGRPALTAVNSRRTASVTAPGSPAVRMCSVRFVSDRCGSAE